MGECNECKYKNSCDNLNYLDVANTCTDLREFVDEIRADAIDEFREKCKSKRYKPSKFTSINVVDYADIDEIAEQLKGAENE